MEIGIPELLIILAIVILIFGVGRISKVAGELGSGIRAFKEGLQGPSQPEKEKASEGEGSQEE
jgi:sec-independent protein translocase protein TatA